MLYPETAERVGVEWICVGSEKVASAYGFASEVHEGQKRKSGEPYFNHCIAVSRILSAEWGIKNEDYLSAALLHDVIEDAGISVQKISSVFGLRVAELVEGVTKEDYGADRDTLKKVLERTYLNPGVAVIKLADRLHNMRTLEFMPRKKQEEKASETLDVYTRLAESLGIWVVKVELEDLCYQYLEPKEFEIAKEMKDSDSRLIFKFIVSVQDKIEQALALLEIPGTVNLRENGVYALKKKQKRLALQGRCSPDDFDGINDLVSFRVRVGNLKEAYLLLGEVHRIFADKVDFEKFDEFIGANKRVNGYQALQTTVNFPEGPVEIAIMTENMEDFNNWGVIGLMRKGNFDLSDYVLKLVFTPTGSTRFLPKDATGVDFALEINPRVLAEAEHIEIDGEIMPLTTVVPNSSTVKVVLGNPRRAPLPGIENNCLPPTRKIILDQRIMEERDRMVAKGMEIMESILAPRGLLVLTDIGEKINPILYRLGCQGADDLSFMVGSGFISPGLLAEELDWADIRKDSLRLTTIRLIGEDRPGILFDVVGIINRLKRNIFLIDQKNTGGHFDLRILVNELTPDEERLVREVLSKDPRFEERTVV